MKRFLCQVLVLLLLLGNGFAETFLGTNASGGSTVFSFTLASGVTNFTLSVTNSVTAFSHLLLKYGGTPTETDFDFISRFDGQDNAINLELPQCITTNYGFIVRTPTSSLADDFSVTLSTNVVSMRSAALPAIKPQAFVAEGTLDNGQWHYFQVEIPTNSPGWRLVLNSAGSGIPSLYLRKNDLPTTGSYFRQLNGQTNGTLVLTETEATSGTWFVGVYQPNATAQYTLFSEVGYLTTLEWDPGNTQSGTTVFTNSSLANATLTGGDYYFKINAQNTDIGAWRTALNVTTGEADIYMQNGWEPTTGSSWRSSRIGSDGFVLHSSQYTVGQDWYILVHASPGAQWSLVSGRAYVIDLGSLATNSDSSSGPVSVGAEGMCFFKTTVSAETLAWRLGLNGLGNMIYVKKSFAPHPASYELSQGGQMLVVPDYLGGGSFNGSYFVGVPGNPGDVIELDSRQHSVAELAFSGSTNLTVTGYGYTTYRVQVPVEQIAWQVKLAPVSGNPNLAVRREKVPNEWNNDAFSEVAGLANDSITLVPPTLSDGTFYITVYGSGAHAFTLTSGNPVITDIAFTSSTVNDDPTRAGWRYYRVADIPSQLGQLGWDLYLANHIPGSEIALRRNAVPGRWNYRQNDSTHINVNSGHVDYSGIGFLQRPGHQADIWYVGVYLATNALGSFTLNTAPLTAVPATFDGFSTNIVNQPVGKWQFFRIDVPADVLGWDIRIKDVISGDPRLVVRRDQLPFDLFSHTTIGSGDWYNPYAGTEWPSGWQWAASNDWTMRSYDPTWVTNQNGRILAMGMGNPLEPGTYYAGVLNQSSYGIGASPMSYTLVSRGIGVGLTIPVTDVAFSGGSAMTNNIEPREAAYYRVVVPTNTPSWQVRLSPTVGEALMKVKCQTLPCIDSWITTPYSDGGVTIQKTGKEQFVLLPENGTNVIEAGTYYIGAVSEGQEPPSSDRIGTGLCSWTFESLGTLAVNNLGLLSETDLVQTDTVEAGAAKAYQFTVPPGTLSFEVRLENRVGNPNIKLVPGDLLPSIRYIYSNHYGHDYYGNYGGVDPLACGFSVVTLSNPTSGVYSLIVNASDTDERDNYSDSGVFADASYSIRVHAVIPEPVAFDGGCSVVTNQAAGNWRFFRIDVPTNALGWDLRLTDVISCDPHLVVRRDQLPFDLSTFGFYYDNPCDYTNWPSGYQWKADKDWTLRDYDPTGTTNQSGRILAMGMGNPLEPGVYYVGVLNDSGTDPMSYTLVSRGIGTGMSIPVVDVSFNNGNATTNNILPREACYYRVLVPTNTPSWQIRLTPTVGEALLKVQWQVLPCIDELYTQTPYGYLHSQGGQKLQKEGKEQWVLLPEAGTNMIRAGTYYLAAVSEGQNPTDGYYGQIGTGACSWTLESFGLLGISNLGLLGETDLVQADTLEGGAAKAYQFTVPEGTLSFEVRLENRVGNPNIKLVPGDRLPSIRYQPYYSHDVYGAYGGAFPPVYDFNVITTPNPTSGVYSLIVNASDTDENDANYQDSGIFSNATYSIRVHAVLPTAVAFDGGSSVVTDQAAGNWQFFRIDVPTNALGWDLRLTDVTSGDPHLVVRRDQLPFDLSTFGFSYSMPYNYTNWPSGYQWMTDYDWTMRHRDPTGTTNENGRILAMGMGNPLEPGLYYVGVLNGTEYPYDSNPMSYTLVSRGIGTGMSIPVVDVSFNSGNATANNILPRDACYYRVLVPTNTPSWQIRLTPTVGEAMLKVQWQILPCIREYDQTPYGYMHSQGGQRIQKEDKEQWVLLPEAGTNMIRAGTYYIAAVSEGQNPTDGYDARIGTDSSSWLFESFGAMGVSNLGTVGESDLVQADTLEGGAAKAYQFTVPPGTVSFEVRLENRVGNPNMKLVFGDQLPSIYYYYHFGGDDSYGNYGGVYPPFYGFNVITRPNPASGVYSLIVNASPTTYDSGDYMDASYTLRVRYPIPVTLNFSSNLNTNGQTNVISGTLADNQREFFKVIVPATNNGQAVLGWRLELAQSQGAATVRVRKDLLPADSAAGTTPFMSLSALLVPPFLTPGTWYVEVRGTGATTYTLTSQMYEPERPVWNMPLSGEPVTTPGLTSPEFGDTGTDTNGVPLPGDRGIDLENGRFHYYAVNVPTNNAVLIRTMLEAISGNPDLYIRAGFPPTLSHDASGNSGSLYERANTGTATEYGNWVPLDGRYESWLTNGVWHFAVRAAGGANCRYRLHITSGTVTDLALDGGSLSSQTLASGDWRYYRVEVPTNAPANWNVTFSQQSGDVVMYVRDVSPPGTATSQTDYRHWDRDAYLYGYTYRKNDGPYGSYDPPGTYSFGVQPLRPGQTYYLGFRAVSDAMFSVSSAVSGMITTPVLVPFLNGVSSLSIPAYGSKLYAFQAPADATSWIHSSVHDASVQLYLEQGTIPRMDTTADWRSAGAANSRFSQTLGAPKGWPWMPNQTYYLLATNTSSSAQSLSITLSGPDLLPVTLAWTDEAVAGKSLTLVGTVTNRGNDTALASWYDRVYLSSNAVWDAQDVSLGSVNYSQSLAAGGRYTWTNTVTLSQWQPGNYYLIVKLDDWNGSSWVFESDETNNTMAFPLTLTAPDLAPMNLTWTGEAVAGKPLTLVGVFTNLGNGTAVSSWSDYVYLSSNAVWDAQDTYLTQSSRSQPVNAGGSYTWTNTLTLSQWQPGTYYLIVKTDNNSFLFESNETNNTLAFPVTLSTPDLLPTNLTWTGEAVAGKTLTLIGVVTNQGNGTAVSSWSDYVYLSSNEVWDAQDVSLGNVYRNQSVPSGASYTWTNMVTLSQWQPGTYYLILRADRDASLYESNEGNNSVAYPVDIVAPDLLPVQLVSLSEAIAGRSVILVGIVTNQGNGSALGSWSDAVYLSSNAVWDAQDVSLGSVSRNQAVAAGACYTWTNTVPLSPWQPGAYYLIVKADNNSAVFESNETNNSVAYSVNMTAITPPPNDLFTNRLVLSGLSIVTTGRNVDATPETGEPAYVNRGRSVWWTWTAPFSGVVTNNSSGSNFDTVMGVYTGSTVTALSLIAQDDDSGDGNASQVTFNAVAGTAYQIAVDGYNGASGIVSLNLFAAGAPQFNSGLQMTNGGMRLSFKAGWGVTNEVQACTNLVNAQWRTVTNLFSATGFLEFIDLDATNYPCRFYRLKVQ